MVLPVMRPGPTFMTIRSTGKFQGMIAPMTPRGVRISTMRASSVSRRVFVSVRMAAKARRP